MELASLSTEAIRALPRADKVRLAQLLDEKQRRLARQRLIPYVQRTMPAYRPAAFHYQVAEALEAVERGEITRLMITAPPRHGKTQLVSKRFPLWYLGRNPSREVIHGSYGGDLSSDAGRELRNLTYSPAHRDVFPDLVLSTDSKAADKFHTPSGGVYIASGVNGPITGRGFHLGIIDDPVKGHEDANSPRMQEKTWDWYMSDFYSRRMQPNAIVVISTRWHQEDLCGKLLQAQEQGGDQWTHLHYKALDEHDEALCPDIIPLEMLLQARHNYEVAGSIYIWNSLYQGDPTPESGTYFTRNEFQTYEPQDLLDERGQPRPLSVYGASDFAVTEDDGDWTVHVVAGMDTEGRIYILDMWREQTESDVWVEALLDLMVVYKPARWAFPKDQIEKSVGPFLFKRARERKVGFTYELLSDAKDKPSKARSLQGMMSTRRIWWPKHAPWYPHAKGEFLTFPRGTHDDTVDANANLARLINLMHPPELSEIPQPTGILTVHAGDAPVPEGYRAATYADIEPERKQRRRRGRG